jgi:UDP-glucose 6-dehydrogenase
MANNNLLLEINATLEQIQKVNEMLAFHKNFKEIDKNTINNFLDMRANFINQLQELMHELQLDVHLVEAA